MHAVDPNGMALRKKGKLKRRVYYSGGPNYQWCLDGHDKIIKFGIAIHGCIDAWSGKILWLEAFTGNHDPRLIAKYYLEAVMREKG